MIWITQLKISRVKVYPEMEAPGWLFPNGESLCELEITSWDLDWFVKHRIKWKIRWEGDRHFLAQNDVFKTHTHEDPYALHKCKKAHPNTVEWMPMIGSGRNGNRNWVQG